VRGVGRIAVIEFGLLMLLLFSIAVPRGHLAEHHGPAVGGRAVLWRTFWGTDEPFDERAVWANWRHQHEMDKLHAVAG
jgi:hypothetical protein